MTTSHRPATADRALAQSGLLLALLHPLTAYAWLDTRLGAPLPEVLAAGKLAICWPFWEGCAAAHVFSAEALRAAVLAYGALGLMVAALWWRGPPRLAHGLHLGLELCKLALIAQDFRLRHNAHTMATFAAAALLLTGKPRQALPVLVTLFYVWAGLLKLTPDWLGGQALPALPVALPTWAVALACQAVVVLELGVVWGLLASERRWQRRALGLLGAFHAASWAIVGYFYPLVMAALLAAVWRCREGEPGLLTPRLEASTWLLAGTLSLLQCVPRLLPGDTALTGEGRWMALHMFDARVRCRATLRGAGGEREVVLPDPLRIHCDPIVVTARAQALCAERGWTADPSVALTLDARRAGGDRDRRVLELPGFCVQPPRYQWLGHNRWIRAD
jgi:hypothetical protein